MAEKKNPPASAVNRQAYHNYFIHDTYEAGVALTGTEVKSIRAGKVNLRDSFAKVEKGEVFLWNAHISPYEQGNRFNHDPLRTRKLLLHRREILKIENALKTKGYAIWTDASKSSGMTENEKRNKKERRKRRFSHAKKPSARDGSAYGAPRGIRTLAPGSGDQCSIP